MGKYRKIPSLDLLYEIDEKGTMRNVKSKRTKAKQKHQRGYQMYHTPKGKKLIHRLVAEVWVPNPSGKKTVNHIDGNKKNNHKDNLEWMTHQENTLHGIYVLGTVNQKGRYKKDQRLTNGRLCFKTFNEIYDFLKNKRKKIGTQKSIERNISKQLEKGNNRETAYGYVWKRCEDM